MSQTPRKIDFKPKRFLSSLVAWSHCELLLLLLIFSSSSVSSFSASPLSVIKVLYKLSNGYLPSFPVSAKLLR